MNLNGFLLFDLDGLKKLPVTVVNLDSSALGFRIPSRMACGLSGVWNRSFPLAPTGPDKHHKRFHD
ncbi:hypothetical protein OAF06_00480 [Akkermansiaceae bacterium]|nr:hypothetical protein [Akkermansiaceae bacterium]MDB4546908.1 hypothetical protein [Akkermansiaceae bacterium]MDB4667236.1 hypothetical protein [Akkermansiaceae bacterium]MDC0274624.1 hypothetical protein [Akkermansiaceae bacterium]